MRLILTDCLKSFKYECILHEDQNLEYQLAAKGSSSSLLQSSSCSAEQTCCMPEGLDDPMFLDPQRASNVDSWIHLQRRDHHETATELI